MDDNPWKVTSFDDFLFYVCPECNYLTKEKDILEEHASEVHYENYSKTLEDTQGYVIRQNAHSDFDRKFRDIDRVTQRIWIGSQIGLYLHN